MQTVILLTVVFILIVVLVEMVEARKRNEADAYLRKQKMARLFDENIALENKAFNVARQYDLECD